MTVLWLHRQFLNTADETQQVVTMEKSGYTCTIHDKRTIYGVETQWFTSCTKFRKQKAASKMMASVFYDKDGILLVDCPEGMQQSHYTPLLDKVKLSTVVLFLRDKAS
jgi:hypothetical protein